MIRIHCSYHKCLTVYFQRVLQFYKKIKLNKKGYKHFQSRFNDFNLNIENYKFISINNHFVDHKNFNQDFRISRFIRDPRDIIISGYFYHKKGSEDWCNIINPTKKDFEIVNGNFPVEIKKNESYKTFLHRLSQEDGIIAEIDFRSKMLNSMMKWTDYHNKIKLYKYEDFMSNEKKVMNDLFKFHEIAYYERKMLVFLAEKFSAKNAKGYKHIRNVKYNQWKEYFTPKIEKYFNDNYLDVLKKYDYKY